MGQVTIYINAETEKRARDSARAEGLSLSKWVAERIARHSRKEWPGLVRELAGAWTDLPPVERIRRAEGKDIDRKRL